MLDKTITKWERSDRGVRGERTGTSITISF